MAEPSLSPLSIFQPVLALVAWTLLVLLLILLARVRAMRAGEVGWQDFSHGESPRVPPAATRPHRAFRNLLEVPLLFYVVCIVTHLAGRADGPAVQLAWAYVALRALHSLIYLSYNRVAHRLVPFALSNGVLTAMLLRLMWPMY